MWGWLALIIGIVYGYVTPGHQDKKKLLTQGLIIGLLIAVVFVIISQVANMNPLGMGTHLIANIIGAVIIALLFVGGVWLGDLLEHRMKK